MNCPHCNKPIDPDWLTCSHCQAELIIEVKVESPNNPYSAPRSSLQHPPSAIANSEGDATGGVIPYKNPKALIAYYLGIASGVPLIGFPAGIAAFVLGIQGLRARKQNPAIKGSAHAWIGIGCGGIFALCWGLVMAAMAIAVIAG